jgi:hypothetical protein
MPIPIFEICYTLAKFQLTSINCHNIFFNLEVWCTTKTEQREYHSAEGHYASGRLCANSSEIALITVST